MPLRFKKWNKNTIAWFIKNEKVGYNLGRTYDKKY